MEKEEVDKQTETDSTLYIIDVALLSRCRHSKEVYSVFL
jgi:hypothetical protein